MRQYYDNVSFNLYYLLQAGDLRCFMRVTNSVRNCYQLYCMLYFTVLIVNAWDKNHARIKLPCIVWIVKHKFEILTLYRILLKSIDKVLS